MRTPTHILVVLDRSSSDPVLVRKAARIARRFGARLELFLCDAEHAYVLKHDYETSHSEAARQDCVKEAIHYLMGLRAEIGSQGMDIAVSAACETPLYEGVVHKVIQSRPDMVVKNAGGGRAAFDPNDWQLMRKCPVTLLMTRGRAWHAPPRFAAAVDVSAAETAGLAHSILATSVMLSRAYGCETDLLYSEPGDVPQDTRAARTEALRKLAQQCNLEGNAVRIFAGDPERTLPGALLEGQYDVLTLGALTHRPDVTTLVGTLTSRLVDAADCDFVLVKPDSSVVQKAHGSAC